MTSRAFFGDAVREISPSRSSTRTSAAWTGIVLPLAIHKRKLPPARPKNGICVTSFAAAGWSSFMNSRSKPWVFW
jgi:hypothetical protein